MLSATRYLAGAFRQQGTVMAAHARVIGAAAANVHPVVHPVVQPRSIQHRSFSDTPALANYNKRGVNRIKARAERWGLPDPFESQAKIVYGCRRDSPTSPWKLNLVAKQIRGMNVEEALAQLEFSPKKSAKFIQKVLVTTMANANANHGVDNPSNMHVFESYVGKGANLGRIRYHAQGRTGRVTKPRTHYFLKLKEGPKEIKEKDPLKKWYMKTKRDQITQQKYPQKIVHSLD